MEVKKGDRLLCIELGTESGSARPLRTILRPGKIYVCDEDGVIEDDAGHRYTADIIDYDYYFRKLEGDEFPILEGYGWKLNPNKKVVDAIIKRCKINGGLCPCVHGDEDYSDSIVDRDLHCPCTDYVFKHKCCCGLYVKEDGEVS